MVLGDAGLLLLVHLDPKSRGRGALTRFGKARLRRAGLVEPHRSGRSVFYRLSREGEQLIELFSERNDGSARGRS
jgi:DNA-binding transcriptional ArsR family regulator